MPGSSSVGGREPGIVARLLWLVILAGIPAAVAWHDQRTAPRAVQRLAEASRPATPPPPVEPVKLYDLTPDQARAFNARIPFSALPSPAARPFRFAGEGAARDRAVDCLAAALYYEAGDDPAGERAVAQVVLNRLRHPAFPKTVCGVVFQGQERTTGCQFTFTCDGSLARIPSAEAWERARKLAAKALAGSVDRKVGYATHYHTDWVVPYWSGSLDKIAAVGTHLFFRWTGWWGTPPAFRRTVSEDEPVVEKIASLSPAHRPAAAPLDPSLSGAALLAAKPREEIGEAEIGTVIGGARLTAMTPDGSGFALELDKRTDPGSYPRLADSFCAGRPQCRLLAWIAPAETPKAFPPEPRLLQTMAFSYIHDAEGGLQKALWNCRLIPRPVPADCMRDRDPVPARPAAVPLPPVARTQAEEQHARPRVETVTIRPPETSPAPAP